VARLDVALGSVGAATLRAWTPIRVRPNRGEPLVDWAIVEGRFTDPFFEQNADRAMQRPFNQVFARRTPIAMLEDLATREPGLAPDGLIFHMSRCGSTLVAQMLAAAPSAIVLSEAQPLDGVLSLRASQLVDDDELVRWLRATTSVLARPRFGEHRLFVKFHAWHILELPLIARAFPGVPWIFLYREPRAVLRSHARSPGAEAIAWTLDPHYFGIERATAPSVPQDEFTARAIAAFCEAALTHADAPRSRFIDYADLPDALFTEVLELFRFAPDRHEIELMRAAARADTKAAGTAFRPQRAEPAAPEIERLASRWLDPVYDKLRAVSAQR
jgi:hypothetical protein